MFIYSLEYDTYSDFDGKLNATIATLGCNFRCGYCHNPHLIFNDSKIRHESILNSLRKNSNFYESVCITGGEPTLHGNKLVDFIKKIKDMDYLVKLDTNGSNPQVLETLINKNLVDYVAMDIKGTKLQYSEIADYDDISNIQKSIDLIRTLDDYEFRTTVLPKHHKKSHISKIGIWLHGIKRYTIQQFRPDMGGGCLNPEYEKLETYTKSELEEFKKLLESHMDEVKIKCK